CFSGSCCATKYIAQQAAPYIAFIFASLPHRDAVRRTHFFFALSFANSTTGLRLTISIFFPSGEITPLLFPRVESCPGDSAGGLSSVALTENNCTRLPPAIG